MNRQALAIIFALIFGLLFLRLLHLQLAEYRDFNEQARENAAKLVPERAQRGIIYDRNGQVLLASRPDFSVRILPYILSQKTKTEREKILKTVGAILGQEILYKVTAAEPIIIMENISLAQAIQIEELQNELDGVVVLSQPLRFAPYHQLAAHVLGYIGEIEKNELDELASAGYRLGDTIGKDGIEKKYDQIIRGRDGGKLVEVDVYGSPLRVIDSLEPLSGPDVKLTIDQGLQAAAEAALAGLSGGVVVLDCVSGEVLVLASAPNYDLNVFSDPGLRYKWQSLQRQNHPFMNRALAMYPPGSIFKVVTMAAALEEGLVTTTEVFNCRGSFKINNRVAECWLGSGHGPINVFEALVWSCDVVFYELGRRLGPDKLADYAGRFGLGSYTEIDLPQERRGIVPTTDWKKQNLKQPWYAGDSINYGIGQGFLQVTPLQMAVAYAALATGNVYQPYVVSEIKDSNGKIIHRAKPMIKRKLNVSKKTLALIRQALRQVVTRGTGVAAAFGQMHAAGKTGTAENPGLAHAWFICFAPEDEPEIVISVFVEHGQHGDQVSARIARDILKWYRKNRLMRALPEEKLAGQYIMHGRRKVSYQELKYSD